MNLQFLQNEKPTIAWKERMDEFDDEQDEQMDEFNALFDDLGEDLITEEVLEQCNIELNSFLSKLESINPIDEDRDVQIMRVVEETILNFNDINHENDYFIETVEREDLAEFISKAAKAAGLEIADDEDITLQWREW